MKDGVYERRAFIPNVVFFHEDHGLLSILKSYNFTIEENSPAEEQVALDPELLGRVFENLLATYNPETQESARKESGAFYTPRSIVDFMVKASLQHYLLGQENLRKLGVTAEQIEELLQAGEKPQAWNSEIVQQLKLALAQLKIFDPACG